MATQPIHKVVLMLGIYICPLIVVGNLILTLGHKFMLIASLINVNDPLISAWLAMIAAGVR